MIPQRYLEEWKTQAPWPANAQVEQDLIITRALVEIFSDDLLKNALAFRGGTALHKLYLQPTLGHKTTRLVSTTKRSRFIRFILGFEKPTSRY